MASVKVEFELQGGDKVVTTNEKIIKQLKEQGVQYNVLEGAIEGVTQASKENTETQVEGTEQVTQSYKEFIGEIKAAEKELKFLEATGQQNTKRYQELTQRVAQFKDAQEEVGRRLSANKSSADAFINSVAGLTGGFAAVQGAIGLFGEESENVQKALLRVQSALSLAQGIEQIKDAKGAFESLGKTVGGFLVNAFSTLRGAIISTGIGALVVTLGVILQRISQARAESQKNTEFNLEQLRQEQERYNNALEENKKLEGELLTAEKGRLAFLKDQRQTLLTQRATDPFLNEQERKVLTNRINLLNIEISNIEKENEKRRQDEFNANEEERLRILRTNNQRKIQLLKDGIIKELAELRLRYNEEKRLAIQTGEDVNVLTQLYQKQRGDIFDRYFTQLSDRVKNTNDDYSNLTKTSYEKDLKELTDNFDKQIDEYNAYLEELKQIQSKNERDVTSEIEKVEEAIRQLENIQVFKFEEITSKYYQIGLQTIVEINKIIGDNSKEAFDEQIKLKKFETDLFISNEKEKVRAYLQTLNINEDEQQKYLETFEARLRANLEIENQASLLTKQFDKERFENELSYQQQLVRLNTANKTNLQLRQNIELRFQKEKLDREIFYIEQVQKLYDKDSEGYKKLELEKLKLTNERLKLNKTEQTDVQKLNDFLKEYQAVINAITQALSDLNEAFNSFYDLRLAKLEAYYSKEFDLLDERKQREIENYALTQEEIQNINDRYALEETALEEKKAKEIKQIEKKRANDQLTFTIAQIIANQSLAIVRALAELGPLAGAIAAGAVGISTAAQVAAAVNQRNIIVKYQDGGILNGYSHAQGGIYAGGVEMEGGEAVINRRSTAMFAPLLSSINQAGGGRPFTSPNLTGNLNLSPNPNTQSISQILNKMSTQRAYILSDDVQSDTARQSRIRRSSTF